ncbi:MAG: beta galactosidase jelly roll domain-containing protein [Ignavibacteriales bacterium]|nr:beta galactosidase jelly roll domain-containing protein [Ignavibacteriales bacterium]
MSFIKKILLLSIITFTSSQNLFARDWERILNLKGLWKFSIGDDKQWSLPNYKDKSWEEIKVPSPWEDQGFYGYDGYAWYRKHFFCPNDLKGKSIFLFLGYIDDVDEVYLNGTPIGASGSFPPEYNTAYSAFRKYYVPNYLIKFNSENVLAVRVYDAQLGGGIVNGDIGFYYQTNVLQADVVLEGMWKFKTGDENEWKGANYNDKEWSQIFVPANWESQGYENYDGFAWYRKKITLPENLKNKKLVLMLGKIDDLDEVFINGKMIGSTGRMQVQENKISVDQEYQKFRGYYIPENLLKTGDNIIAVRVYDGWIDGGIYEGPIGLITQDKYIKFWRSQKKSKSFWDFLFNR